MATPPADHPPIDWSKWEPAGKDDVRSPCPMLNALANHHVLPHDGRAITKPMAVEALVQALNLDATVAGVFAHVALGANPDHAAHSFDLDQVKKHGLIEHDVSLTRQDYALGGEKQEFDREVWDGVLAAYDGVEETSFALASKARYGRLAACKAAHQAAGKTLGYGLKEMILSYGETALFMAVLGDPVNGKIPLRYLRVLFEEERVPFNEGWKRSDRVLGQGDMNHLIYSLVMANEHKAAEAADVGLGTVQAVTSAVRSLMPTYCAIM